MCTIVVDDAVEKIAVVRDEQQRAGIAREPVLEPQHGVEVEVIGGLVEQQQVRAAHQRLREIEPHAPAAGEARDRIAVARVGEAQSGEQRRGARARRVAADRLEAVMQLARALAARRRRSRRRPPRPPARARSRAARGRRRARTRSPALGAGGVSCATCAIVHAAGSSMLAGVRLELAAEQREQARLAAPVRRRRGPTLWPACTVRFAPSSRRLRAARQRQVGDPDKRAGYCERYAVNS